MYTVQIVNKFTNENDYVIVDDLDEIDTTLYIIVEYWENYVS